MDLQSYTVNPFAENTYLLTKNNEALIIDPGFFTAMEFKSFKHILKATETDLTAVLLTHAHVDHILGIHRVLDDFDVPVYLNHEDLYLWNNFESQSKMFGLDVEGYDFTPEPLPVEKNWSIGNFTMDVLFTPGHSPEHVSFYFEDEQALIAGDTLFKESIGRTDLYKGDLNVLRESIQQQLYSLPDETTVYPGHGPKTNIGHEKQYNGYVREDAKQEKNVF